MFHSVGMMARARAAKRVMNVSLCDLCSPASSTRRMIFETVLSP